MLFLSLLVCLFPFYYESMLSNYRLNFVLVMASSLVLLVLFSFVYAIWKPSKMKHVIHWTTDKIAPFFEKKTNNAFLGLTKQIYREIERFHDSIRVFFSEGRVCSGE